MSAMQGSAKPAGGGQQRGFSGDSPTHFSVPGLTRIPDAEIVKL